MSIDILKNPKVYVHCKDIDTLFFFRKSYPDVHVFFHDVDEVVLTSKNELWTYPGKKLTEYSICVMDDENLLKMLQDEKIKILGICSDNLKRYESY
jgi:hypothetical protein